MATTTRKSPAPIRYEETHPTVSSRLSRDVHDLLEERPEKLGGVSFANFVKDSLGLLQLRMPDIDGIRERAWEEGFNQALEITEIWYFCSVCRIRTDIEPNSDSHRAMMRYMEEHSWGHASCRRHQFHYPLVQRVQLKSIQFPV